ncbi:MAG: 50S ribosomal protein L25 [Pseudomonadota bacterium]
MERATITAEKRMTSKGIAKKLRAKGKIPATLYGKNIKPLSIVVDKLQFEKATKTTAGMNVMLDLTVEKTDSGLAFIRDYQADPFKREFKHIDFQAISLDETIEIEVPIELIGASKGVKEGGVLVQERHTLEIKAKPNDIPDKITIDITELDVGDGIHADDLTLPKGVEFPHITNFSLVAVVPPAKEEVVAPPAEELAEGEVAAAPAEGEGAVAEKKEPEKKAEKEAKA